jgi:SAM-dependent methyltransferase
MEIMEPAAADSGQPRLDRFSHPMILESGSIRRYNRPNENTVFPLEYAFHLLGDITDKTVVDLSCSEGRNALILAALGAHVICVDSSEERLNIAAQGARVNGVASRVEPLVWESAAIPVAAGSADHVLGNGTINQADSVVTARQIRRILKPSGTAVFETPLPFLSLLAAITETTTDSRPPLTRADVEAACRAVGVPGRRREFWPRWVDGRVLRRFQFARHFATSLVWEACKEC